MLNLVTDDEAAFTHDEVALLGNLANEVGVVWACCSPAKPYARAKPAARERGPHCARHTTSPSLATGRWISKRGTDLERRGLSHLGR